MKVSAPSFWRVTFLHRCPACGKGSLYAGLLTVARRCSACDFPLGEHDSGDGPAFFVITIVGTVVTGLATWLELAKEPPLWVHALLWAPVTLLLSLWLLRVFKSALIAMQYRHRIDSFDSKDGGTIP